MARPTRLTPELTEAILALVRAGNFVEPASRAAGIHPATLYRWKALAKGKREPYASFARLLAQAEAESEAKLVALLVDAAPRNPTAAIAVLRQRFPDRWTPIEKRESMVNAGSGWRELIEEARRARKAS